MGSADKKSEGAYRALRAELDEVMERLQNPESDVDEAVLLYERAVQLTQKIAAHLESAENRVQKVRMDFSTATDGDRDMLNPLGSED